MILHFFLITIALSQIALKYDLVTVNLATTNSVPINNATSADTCQQMLVGDFCLFHLNSESTVQNWPLSNLPSGYSYSFPVNASQNIRELQLKGTGSSFKLLNIANGSVLEYKSYEGTKLGTFHKIELYSGGVPDQYVGINSKDYLLYHGVTDSF